jgi:hypothetical protein
VAPSPDRSFPRLPRRRQTPSQAAATQRDWAPCLCCVGVDAGRSQSHPAMRPTSAPCPAAAPRPAAWASPCRRARRRILLSWGSASGAAAAPGTCLDPALGPAPPWRLLASRSASGSSSSSSRAQQSKQPAGPSGAAGEVLPEARSMQHAQQVRVVPRETVSRTSSYYQQPQQHAVQILSSPWQSRQSAVSSGSGLRSGLLLLLLRRGLPKSSS